MPTAKRTASSRLRAARPPGADIDDAPAPPIRARGLTKHYGSIVAVDALDLEVRAGEIFGLLGPNGAGKTTTILMILGLSEPTSGKVRVLGMDPARQPLDVKRQVGYLPDNAGFYGNLTGRENLRYTARLNGLQGRTAEARLDEVLEQVGLTGAADRRVDTYSRGMRQRLGIADALVKDPRILILDEPTIAIDPIGVAEILALVRRLVDERGLALLLASHLLDQVQSVCDRVGIFSAGRLIGQGTIADLVRLFGDGRGHVEVGADVDPARRPAVTRLIEGIPNVTSVVADPLVGTWSVSVTPAEAESGARGAIATALLGAGFGLTTLRAVPPSLDEIYRSAVGSMTSAPAEVAV